jgi:choline transport protein
VETQVNPHFHVPANAIVATAVFVCVVSLINIGSTVAFNAVLSLASTAMMGTYLIPIGMPYSRTAHCEQHANQDWTGCVTWRRLCHLPSPKCRWSLGRAGLPVNIIALTYSCWCFIWSFFPNAYQVTPQNFNWACVLFVGLMAFASLMYALNTRYEGPVVKVISAEQDSD